MKDERLAEIHAGAEPTQKEVREILDLLSKTEAAYGRLRNEALALISGRSTGKAVANAIKDFVQPGYAPENRGLRET